MRDRLVAGIKWNIANSIIVSASNFLSAIVAARILGLDGFGAFSIIRSTVFMMASVAGIGLGITAVKYIAEIRNSDPARLGVILGLCSIFSGCTSFCFFGILFVFAPQIAIDSLHAPHIIDQLRIASLYILFVALNGYQAGALSGFEAFAKLAKINLLQAITSLILICFLSWGWGLSGAALALGLSAMLNWFFHQLAIRDELRKYGIKIRYKGVWQEKGVLINFTLPAALAGIIGAITVWNCNAHLVRQSTGLAQIAIFTAANNFRSFIGFVPSLVTRVASPVLCNLFGEKDISSYSRVFWWNIAVSIVASTTVAGILVFAAPYFFSLFGKGFSAGGAIAVAVAAMSVIEVLANAFYQPLLAQGKLWWQVRIIFCWSIVLLAVTYTTVGEYGALGLAYAYLAAHSTSAAMYIYITYRLRKLANKIYTEM